MSRPIYVGIAKASISSRKGARCNLATSWCMKKCVFLKKPIAFSRTVTLFS